MITTRLEADVVARAASAGAGAAAGGRTRQYLTFALGSESYAAAIADIREILEVPTLTVVPLTPPFVRGVMNLRGAVVPVIDLSTRFELGATQIARRTCVVVVEVPVAEGADEPPAGGARGEKQVLGVLVDAVHEVLEIGAGGIEAAPKLGTRIDPDFIGGMVKVGGRLLVVLELGRVLAQDELERLVSGHGMN